MGYKIVRDHVEEWARAHDVSGIWRPCKYPINSLTKKLFEEAGEYVESLEVDELYDLRDVLNRLISLQDPYDVAAARHFEKVQRLGMFEKLIEWSPVPIEHQQTEAAANGMRE